MVSKGFCGRKKGSVEEIYSNNGVLYSSQRKKENQKFRKRSLYESFTIYCQKLINES